MTIAATIEAKLTDAFAPLSITVIDESHMHAGHAGARPAGETHFRVDIVAAAFAGQSRVARQRQVYALLADEFAAGLHALSIRALTPDELPNP